MTTYALLALPLGLALAACAGEGQQAPTANATGASFPFVIPWDDALKGTATDVTFLNDGPAGSHGPILVKQGVFVERDTGKRVRFLGTNLGARAAFPATKDEADKVAGRLAKAGVNLVRFHHLQNGWDLEGGTIWKPGRTFIEIDPAQLDKLDYFIAALIKNGVYVNINLTTSRDYKPELGFPESVTELKNFAKKVDKFNPRMIELQRQYAKELLDRTNPYTGRKYKDEPGVAFIEINNENSLVGWPGESPGAGLSTLPEPFRGEIVGLWNQWLERKYGDDVKLKAAWSGVSTITGESLIGPDTAWTNENQSNSDVTFTELPAPAGKRTAKGYRVVINSHKGPSWHVQAHLPGLTLESGKVYTVKFVGQADRPTGINVASRLDKPDWRFLGPDASVQLGPEPKAHAVSFRAQNTEPGHARIGFVLGDARGTITLTEVQLFEGASGEGPIEGQTIAQRTIEIPNPGLGRKWLDWIDFLVETETAFSNGMRNYLRDDLGFTATNMIDTQIAWGSLTAFRREAAMEFADNHAYWQHPTFLGTDWDPKNWVVNRQSMVPEMAGGGGELGRLARERVWGKPYSVSEYNHPAPSDYQAEMMPLYATFAALQDWDAIYTFAWDATPPDRPNNRIQGFFDCNTNPAKAAFYPSSAIIFRQGLLEPATGETVVGVPELPWEKVFTQQAAFAEAFPEQDLFATKLGIHVGKTWSKPGTGSPVTARDQRYLVDTPKVKALAGFVRGGTVAFKDAGLEFAPSGAEFAAMTWVPLDGKPLGESARTLLTLVGRVENVDMGWNAERTSVSDQWGEGPTHAEVVTCSVTLETDGPRKVWALDGTGKRVRELPAKHEGGTLSFAVDQNAASLWFEVVKP